MHGTKKHMIIALLVALLISAVIIVFVMPQSSSPYASYQQALEKLKGAASFRSVYSETRQTLYPNRQPEATTSSTTTAYSCNNGNMQAICELKYGEEDGVTIYYLDGYTYASGDSRRSPWAAADTPLQAALAQVFAFPESAVAEQTAAQTAEGTLLSFVMDSEKYYEYQNELYHYAGERTYDYIPEPVFAVLIDGDGFLRRITGEFRRQSRTESIPHETVSFSVTYDEINSLGSLDFSDLITGD